MKMTSRSGAVLAAAAATLFLAGTTVSTVTYAAGEGKCMGANACKGQNACKSQGFSTLTKEKCDAAKGKYMPS